tara:strand:- start:672 stop:1211 length:540 start_codon:yes stop_codon:yes gene_type:complete
MNFHRIQRLLGTGLSAIFLVGCASQEPEYTGPSEPIEESFVEEQTAEPVGPRVESGKLVVSSSDSMGISETLGGIFLFDFDQAVVRRSGHAELDKHASALSGDRYLRARLEGHADERGTREYNLALGERRANAVRAYLVAQGASNSQIEVISYGEEKPFNTMHNESGWAQNRRVEIVYR